MARHTQKVLATVTLPGDAAGQRINAVGPMGQVLLSVGESREFRLVWGAAANQQCGFSLDL